MIPAVIPSYSRADVLFERGEGLYLIDKAGRRYLDFAAGVAVNSLGHGHPHLVEALTRQAGKLWHCSNLYRIEGQERLAQRLVDNTFADTSFFCNSGAEAIEAGLKMIRKYHDETGTPDRYRMIAFEGSFHGRTLATISAGANKAHQAGFGPLVDGFDHVAFGNLNEVRNAIGPETAGIVVEPVQGEGGIFPADPAFLRGLRAICDEFGLLLFFDEVQTGVGRTGKFFAYEWAGIAPDVMAVAKGLGGGFPIGVCLATERAAVGIRPGTHGSTFGGNPLAMAAANAVLDVVLENGFLARVERMGKLLMDRLKPLAGRFPKAVAEVRGLGLMIGLKSVPPAYGLVDSLREAGLLTVPAADNVVRLLPPLTIDENHIEEACAILERTLGQVG